MVKNFKSFKKESLKTLTLKFIDYIFENNFKTELDLEKVSEKLKIKKRRLYDLTNVLEGIGYLKKYKRNIMKITNQFLWQVLTLKTKGIIKLENMLIQESQNIEKEKDFIEKNKDNFLIQDQKNEKDFINIEKNNNNFLIQDPKNEKDINFKVAFEQVFNNFN